MALAGALVLSLLSALLFATPQNLETEPDYITHFNSGLALSMENKDAEAVAEFRKTLEEKPGLYEADLNLGMILLRDKKAAEAVPVLKEAVNSRPELARPNFYYAQALFETGDFAGAEAHYGVAAKADPKSSAAAELGLGQSLLKESKLDAAAEHLRTAIGLDARYRESLLELAAAYERAQQFSAAAEIYRGFPENPAAQKRLGDLLLAANDYKAAIVNLEQQVKAAPTVTNRRMLADAYRMDKRFADAIQQLKLAVASEPGNFELRMDLGKSLRDQHDYAAAAPQFIAATKIRPDAVPAWNELAAALVIDKNFAEALGALDHARALGKETPGQLYFRAISLDNLKQHQPAVDAYRQFLSESGGRLPDEEFLARQRIRIIESEMKRR